MMDRFLLAIDVFAKCFAAVRLAAGMPAEEVVASLATASTIRICVTISSGAASWLSVVPMAIAMPIMPLRAPACDVAGLESPRKDMMKQTEAMR